VSQCKIAIPSTATTGHLPLTINFDDHPGADKCILHNNSITDLLTVDAIMMCGELAYHWSYREDKHNTLQSHSHFKKQVHCITKMSMFLKHECITKMSAIALQSCACF
jgi:hypothetical protein